MSGEADHWPMGPLGLDEDERDRKTIRRAYAAKLKQIDQGADPAGFQALREAFEFAKVLAEDAAAGHERRVIVPEEGAAAPAGEDPPGETAPRRTEAPDLDDIGFDVAPEDSEEGYFEDDWEDDAPADDFNITAEEQALRQKIATLLDSKASPWEWQAVLDDPVLFDMAAANRIENQIFHGLRERITYDSANMPKRPAFANRAWIEMMDQRFDWSSDFVMFQRKFGWYAEQVLLALSTAPRSRMQGPGQQAAEYVDRRKDTGRRPWLFTAGMICVGYFVLRLFLFDLVLP